MQASKPRIAIILAVGALLLCTSLGLLAYFAPSSFGLGAGKERASEEALSTWESPKLDPDSIESLRAWAESTVARLKDVEARGDDAATRQEVGKVVKTLRSSVMGKEVRWALPVNGVTENGRHVDVDSSFGKEISLPPDSHGPRREAQPNRQLYLRVILDLPTIEGLHIGRDITAEAASKLHKGDRLKVTGMVFEAQVDHRDPRVKPRKGTRGMDSLDDFCITLVVAGRS